MSQGSSLDKGRSEGFAKKYRFIIYYSIMKLGKISPLQMIYLRSHRHRET